ncbi:MAG: iron-siderophore transport system permease protein [Thermoleophilaceae bacterium]|nr:iron-siderophore transport system permease protein [Thermoleophilaceae bacterium]
MGLLLAGAVFAAFAASVSVGDFPIALRDVVPAILGYGDTGEVFVARELRVPRALAAVLVGAAFGISGAIFQAVARNPLASPDILGIMAGASAATVFVITVAGPRFALMATAALGGAFALGAAIYLLAYRQGVSSYRFVLVGIGLDAVAVAVTSYLLTEAELFEAAAAMIWLTGSLNAAGWESVAPLACVLALLTPAALALAGRLRVIQLGDDAARGLGVGVERSRLALLGVGVALAGVGTAVAGPVAFVAFLAAPIARRLTRAPMTLVPAGLAGALIVLVADVAGRRLFAPTEIPVGIFTSLCGAPYFLYLLARANRSGAGG